ncbi:hypothetical protein EW146_g10308 [Bondarzewia mesenterica]|uniref:U1-type domain-containing protein n=1 Tax=Bondarzewia mesenterica TaxID=1095465 RepID=A0A4S4KZQ1_9AGAM|nr:hypothetical protein EW146_g10308 [Bondarzewia mesenterica]
MSEYWQHENGLRHKGNKEQFVHGLYRAGEKCKKDLEEEKREMVRIEQAVQAVFSQDVRAGHAKASLSMSISCMPTSVVTSSSKKFLSRPSNTFLNYSIAESLGYTDPDLECAHAEAERHQQQGFVGEWQETRVSEGPVEEGKKHPAEAVQEDEEHGH